MEGTALCPCLLVCLCQAAPSAPALLASPDNIAKHPRIPHVTQTTPVPTEVSALCYPLTNTSVNVPEDGQDHGVSMRTAVSLVPVPTVEGAALCLVVATCVPVLPATKVHAALMTQTNVKTHLPYARMRACVSTPLAPTSAPVPRDLRANTAKALTSLAHLRHA